MLQKKTKYKKIKIKNKNITDKKIILIPDIKINIDQLKKTKRVCPRSGWITSNNATPNVVKKESEYFMNMFVYFWLLKIELKKIIKKGLTNSIGWNLGKKFRSIHLFDPLTSIPINGTKIRKIKDNIKIKEENLKSLSLSMDDKPKITIVPKRIKIKCLKKNE